MLQFPHIDPVIFRIGPFAMRWYGLMYILGFIASYALTVFQLRNNRKTGIPREAVDDLFFYLIIGLIVGARLGYAVFYNLGFYIDNPLEVFMVWHGGMSFHGGLIGAFTAGVIIMARKKLPFLATLDLVIPTAPVGICLGRIGNFINGELFGKPTEVPWGMYFPLDQEGLLRHPSQLYEAFGEGILLFAVLWFLRKRSPADGFLLATYLMGYGLVRFFIEFYRQPDAQIGYLWGFLTMGQVLCLIMIGGGAGIMLYRKAKR